MASPRFYCPLALSEGLELDLPPTAARHAQVLRMQPGHSVVLFGSDAGQWQAQITAMGKNSVRVQALCHETVSCEAERPVHLAVGLIANERMDYLVEKATELGAASFRPVLAERCVLRLSGERAEKRVAHWQAIAVAACEQSGRNTVPLVLPIQSVSHYLLSCVTQPGIKGLLSLNPQGQGLRSFAQNPALDPHTAVHLLSGTEGGWTLAEEELAHQHGFSDVRLVERTLRADTAPLAALAALVL